MEWLSGSAVVAAVGSTLALVQVDTTHPDLMCEVVQLPQFHTDCIRELAINPANTVPGPISTNSVTPWATM